MYKRQYGTIKNHQGDIRVMDEVMYKALAAFGGKRSSSLCNALQESREVTSSGST